MAKTEFKIEGAKTLDIKFNRYHNFLGKEYNNAMLKIAKYIVNKFKNHINKEKTESGRKFKATPQLEPEYEEIKKIRWGKAHPILRASDKMYNDIRFKINSTWKQFALKNKINLTFGFKTKRSEKIAGYHVEGIQTKSGLKIRDPFFITQGEESWIVRVLNKSTRDALRKSRLKRS